MSLEAFAWLLTPLIPALVALYFLKLKRREQVVSSTILWKKSLEDLRVNAPFQKLRRSLLLLLQLLILAGLILAASRPMITGEGEAGMTRILLIDCSGSMNVREKEGTRLDAARKLALEAVEAKAPADLMAVIEFSNRPALAQSLTSDLSRLRRAIEQIQPTSCATDFRSALQTAASVAEAAGGAEILLYSDGGFGQLSAVAPELERLPIRFFPIGAETENLGIVELDGRQAFAGQAKRQIFAAVANSGALERQTTLSLYEGDILRDAARLTIPPGKSAGHVFDGSSYAGQVVRLEIDAGGALPDDDRAWIRLDEERPIRLLIIGDANWFLDKVIQAHPTLNARRISLAVYDAMRQDGRLDADAAQVLLFDRQAPAGAPDRPSIFIGCYPPIPEVRAAAAPGGTAPPEKQEASPGGREPQRAQNPALVDWDRGHPVNRFLAFADLLIAESFVFQGGPGFHSAIDSGDGSIAGIVSVSPPGKPSFNVLILGFDIFKTNWPWLSSFPIFFANAIAWLGSEGGSSAVLRYHTGEALIGYPPKEARFGKLEFLDPAARAHAASLENTGAAVFAETGSCGVYSLNGDGKPLERFAVSMLSAAESRIATARDIQIGSSKVAARKETKSRRDLWKWFALAALVVCLLEWWVYNRRMTL